jgi:hypothetical protein
VSEPTPKPENAEAVNGPGRFDLSSEHRMLIDIRDTLYDGSWDDFTRDLEARCQGRPHVFETVHASPDMQDTIRTHLRLIREMREWEIATGQTLQNRPAPQA